MNACTYTSFLSYCAVGDENSQLFSMQSISFGQCAICISASVFLTKPPASSSYSCSYYSQVVSPEFTFYDSSKSFLDDSSHGEKLLRAKTDVSFM